MEIQAISLREFERGEGEGVNQVKEDGAHTVFKWDVFTSFRRFLLTKINPSQVIEHDAFGADLICLVLNGRGRLVLLQEKNLSREILVEDIIRIPADTPYKIWNQSGRDVFTFLTIL